MYLKKLINKKTFDKNGYVLLNTSLSKNLSFDKLCSEIETCLNKLIKNSNIKKLGGYIVGNLNVNQGPFGLKLYSLRHFQILEFSYFLNREGYEIICRRLLLKLKIWLVRRFVGQRPVDH